MRVTMWSYWRDKYGVAEALESYYPAVVADIPELAQALFQIKAAEALIDKIMSDAERD